MDAASRYLILPRKYCDWLGGLRWSSEDDTIVYGTGETFAFQEELALFLEGFAAESLLIHFGHIVHLLDLFRPFTSGPREITGEFEKLHQAFRDAGNPYRNAGTFAAALCRDLPPATEKVSAAEVCHHLRNPHAPLRWFVSQFNNTLAQAEVPPVVPAAFEAYLARHLAAYDREDLKHWLRNGRGSVKKPADMLVRQVVPPSPRNLTEIVAGMLQRPRLSGAAPFVGQLVSALALPPRRLESQELPIGGYTDVSTRGQHDQILPSQFVLDDLEFIRRFAEHELLHFRREEPQTAVKEELVVLLDQGVRTWGDVRLVLSAAAAALAKLADRRRIRFLFAGTSSEGRLIDPLESDAESLAAFLEASDLTANPALALEGVLQQPSDAVRDLVLLSQSRNLREEDVLAASRRMGSKDRLFAVGLDDQGRGRLSEIKHGAPVPVREFRVDMTKVERRPDSSEAPDQAGWPATPWKGQVEPIGFPFQFGISDKIGPELFDFDHAGEWLFTASPNGMIFAWSVDDHRMEVLPRGWHHGAPVNHIHALVGVAGGVAVLGSINTNNELLVVHYDLVHRECQVYGLGVTTGRTLVTEYFREYHTVRIYAGSRDKLALELGTGKLYPPPAEGSEMATVPGLHRSHAGSRAKVVHQMDADAALAHGVVRRLPVLSGAALSSVIRAPFLRHNTQDGALVVNGMTPPWRSFIAYTDGVPTFRDCRILEARCSGQTLAVLTAGGLRAGYSLRLFRGPESVPLAEYPVASGRHGFVLSRDGRRLARQIERYQVEVRDVMDGGPALMVTAKGGSHNQVEVYLGDNWLATQVGWHLQLVRWGRNRLEVHSGWRDLSSLLDKVIGGPVGVRRFVEATNQQAAKAQVYDSHRFVKAAKANLLALVDRHGQVAMLDREQQLICMFFVYRTHLAAWMPGNIRYGPAHLTGSPPSPGADVKIGTALWMAGRGVGIREQEASDLRGAGREGMTKV